MQELRFVLIIVGALAIAALLFHGLWSSKKEGQKKFGDRPLGKLDDNAEQEDEYVAPEDDFEIIRKTRNEPDFGLNQQQTNYDPLDDVASHSEQSFEHEEQIHHQPLEEQFEKPPVSALSEEMVEEELPSFSAKTDVEPEEFEKLEPQLDLNKFDDTDEELETKPQPIEASTLTSAKESSAPIQAESEPEEPEMQVIVMNVHCAGSEDFVGTQLFDSMRQNGLIYGEMDIFHRHADLSGTGKVLFSVANMMQPGTLQHNDPATFTTKGISFFMTLPCFGEAEQNFKLMLRTAQQIADDLGGNVLDDKRNLMTPTRLDAYRKQIQDFNAAKVSA
ncbi:MULTISPECIES: cell division protein ZipA [Vibrio]|uniref:Cell division protein ZipA n=1 Tax=Vibrio mediterranei TaxID=689 RepID=A0A3G4VGD2_9VIBR|nr:MULTISPECIES: cell division protein ZipA [Vibrio]AYV22071.1 cell division protein ZipA [Vibrio mediterranei]EDL51155.1 cell division protein ZipA [Vibrio mediterranei AK1]MCF4171690.1 cell division protein ZipA [Vibrio sp. McD22-P3]MCY9851713.1 cell division protein ZipA [Vibrio mediterranei]USE01202.1 cell division protein ZipA [Vibrio sp. SCSIO 43133]